MRHRLLPALCILGSVLAAPLWAAPAVRISQIYPAGGGSAGPTSPYGADYVELLNASGSPVDVGGWFLANGRCDGTCNYGCPTCNFYLPAGTTIAPCGYLLIQTSPRSPYYGAKLPISPDVALAGPDFQSVGSLALVSDGYVGGPCIPLGGFAQDIVSWNAILYCPEAGQINYTYPYALVRKNEGMAQTYNNAADFYVDVGTPTPHNSASPRSSICLSTPARSASWGHLKVIYR